MTEDAKRPEWMKETESGKILGKNARCYPIEIFAPNIVNVAGFSDLCFDGAEGGYRPRIKVVLVQGSINDYAAYAGCGSDLFVRDHGDKISFEEACVHFPGGQLQKERYRA